MILSTIYSWPYTVVVLIVELSVKMYANPPGDLTLSVVNLTLNALD